MAATRLLGFFVLLWLSEPADADGQTRSCAEPVTATKPCYRADLPPGPPTVALVHPEATITHELELQVGELERRVQLVPTVRLLPMILGALGDVAGGVIVAVALNMEDTGTLVTGAAPPPLGFSLLPLPNGAAAVATVRS